MIVTVLVGIILLILFVTLVLIIKNKPDLWFWLFLNLFFDPGGFVEGVLKGKILGPLITADVFILGIVICLLTVKVNWRFIFGDQFLRKFLFFLLIYSSYYFIVYGGIVPYLKNDLNYTAFLIKSRVYIYGLIILIFLSATYSHYET